MSNKNWNFEDTGYGWGLIENEYCIPVIYWSDRTECEIEVTIDNIDDVIVKLKNWNLKNVITKNNAREITCCRNEKYGSGRYLG